MNRVARVASLSARRYALLLEALGMLSLVTPILRFGPDGWTGRVLQHTALGDVTNQDHDPETVAQVVAAVRRASACVPRATCLGRALTGWWMLSRRNHRAIVRLGVKRDESRGFDAHAWLEFDGRVVIGGEAAAGFTPLSEAS